MSHPSRLFSALLLLFAVALALPAAPAYAVEAISGLTVAPVTQQYALQLTWRAPTVGAVQVQRSLDGVNAWTTVITLQGNAYYDGQVGCSLTYHYRARVVEFFGYWLLAVGDYDQGRQLTANS